MVTVADLLKDRFGLETEVGREMEATGTVAQILSRRSIRRYRDEPVPDELLDVLLACAQSAPAKSDLQQYSIVVVTDPDTRTFIGGWEGNAPVFLVFCADMRRIQRLGDMRGHRHRNNNMDTFMNATADCALAMMSFIVAAEGVGLGTCPISQIRNRIEEISARLGLPDGVFPLAGLCVGWPAVDDYISMRLPPSVVVHRDRYDETKLAAAVEAYDRRRHAVYAIPPEKQRHTDRYGALDYCPWSENVTRQLSVPERPGFRAWLKRHGFDLS